MDGGSAFIEILFFGMVAAFLVLRLRSVLGRRMGHERDTEADRNQAPARDTPPQDDNVVQMPGTRTSGDPVDRGVAAIRQADRSFDPDEFVTGAKTAFELILTAFANGDRDTLRSLASRDVFQMMEGEMTRREAEEQTLEFTLVRIREAKIVEADLRGSVAQVTVKLGSEQINVVRDSEGHAIQGQHGSIESVTDVWAFARDMRSSDPNWTLTEIREAADDA